MSFKLNEEQTGLRDSLRKFFGDEITSDYLRKRIESDSVNSNRGRDEALWKKILELGLLSYFASEDEDERPGFRELSVIASEAGRALLPVGLSECIAYGPYLLYALLHEEERTSLVKNYPDTFLSDITEGRKVIAYVDGANNASGTPLSLRKKGNRVLFSGQLDFVLGAAEAEYLMIAVGKNVGNNAGVYLTCDSIHNSEKFQIMPRATLDLTQKRFDVLLEGAECVKIDGVDVDHVENIGRALRACEVHGLCSHVVELTAEYVSTRKQFGVPVGGFQAVQHRLVDMYVQTEALEALSGFAAWAAENSTEQFPLSSHAALVYASSVGPNVVEGSIQLHGGIGFTWEYDLHLYLRRARTIAALYEMRDSEATQILELAEGI